MVAIVLIIDFFIMLFGEDERKDGIIVLILTIIGIFYQLIEALVKI
jgi:hypothetical protein